MLGNGGRRSVVRLFLSSLRLGFRAWDLMLRMGAGCAGPPSGEACGAARIIIPSTDSISVAVADSPAQARDDDLPEEEEWSFGDILILSLAVLCLGSLLRAGDLEAGEFPAA